MPTEDLSPTFFIFEGWNVPGPHLRFYLLADWREPQKEKKERKKKEEERERWLGQLRFGFAVGVKDGYHK